MLIARSLTCLCALLFGATLHAQPAPSLVRTEIPLETLATLSTISSVYADYDGRKLKLDLIRPKERSGPLPAVVCIHGGGWRNGDRGSQTQVAQALAANGYVAVTITYRLRDEAIFPAAIQDCKAAVRWLRANAKRYGINPEKIGATGLSAGGHLAALLATSGGVEALEGEGGNSEFSSAIQACVAAGAQSDLEVERIQEVSRTPDDRFYRGFLGDTYDKVPEQYALASPRHHLDAEDPPLAFATGERDHESTQAEAMRRDLMAKGIATGLLVIPEAPHAFQTTQSHFDAFMQFTLAFFDRHLKQQGSAAVKASGAATSFFGEQTRWRQIGGGYAGCEGAQWIDGEQGAELLFAAHHDRFAFRWTPKGGLKVWRDDSPEATSFRPDGQGGYYVVQQTDRKLTRWNEAGEVIEVLADGWEGKRLNRPNDARVAPDGAVWFTDPAFLFKQRPEETQDIEGEYVFRVDPRTQRIDAVITDRKKPNGIAFNADGSRLYIGDSGSQEIWSYEVDAAGAASEGTLFHTLPTRGLDGLTLGPDGNLWVCGMEAVHLVSPKGETVGRIDLPAKPTGVAFHPRGWVAITTRDACFVAWVKPEKA